jgi:hypothetical protein
MEEARILIKGKSQAKKATRAVVKNPMGMAIRAGMRKPTSMTATTKMGRRARKDKKDKDMVIAKYLL